MVPIQTKMLIPSMLTAEEVRNIWSIGSGVPKRSILGGQNRPLAQKDFQLIIFSELKNFFRSFLSFKIILEIFPQFFSSSRIFPHFFPSRRIFPSPRISSKFKI